MDFRVLARESRNGNAISQDGDPVRRSRLGEREEWGKKVSFIHIVFIEEPC